MNRTPLPPDDSWESDAVWKLLEQAPARPAGRRFAEETVRLACSEGQPNEKWWQRLTTPVWASGLVAAAAALAFAVVSLQQPPVQDPVAQPVATITAPRVDDEPFAEIQAIAEAEVLDAAADHLDNFTDYELVSLIGF